MAPNESIKSPAFQFYPNDFLSDSNVVQMSLQERGAYITLLCHCWNDGSLPADVNRIARLIGASRGQMQKMWPAVSVCFRPHQTLTGRLIHPRLERELDKQDHFRRRQSDNGRLGGRPRKPDESQTIPTGNPSLSSGLSQTEPKKSSSSSSSSSTPVEIHRERESLTRARGSNPSDFPEGVLNRVGDCIDRYKALHLKWRGVHYMGHPQKDFPEAALLCEVYTDAEIDKLATYWLNVEDDQFATNGTRTLAKFRSRATWCAEQLKERGL